MTRTATVSIGRRANFGDKPNLPAGQWRAFQRDLRAILQDTKGDVHFAGLGNGFHPEFYIEESYTVVFAIEEGQVLSLSNSLSKLAAEYFQDSVALTVGDTVFCEVPKRPEWLYTDGTNPLD